MFGYYFVIAIVGVDLYFLGTALSYCYRNIRSATVSPAAKWRQAWLAALILLGGACYVVTAAYIIVNPQAYWQNSIVALVIAFVYFFGSIFVWLTFRFFDQMLSSAYGREADIISRLPLALAVIDSAGRIISVNPPGERMLTAVGVKSSVGSEFLGSATVRRDVGLTDLVATGLRGQPFEKIIEGTALSGSLPRWLRVRGAPVMATGGDLKYLIFTAEDVTVEYSSELALKEKEMSLRREVDAKTDELSRRMAEAEKQRDELTKQAAAMLNIMDDMKRKDEDLTASESKYRAFIENTADLIYAVDVAGILTYISPQISVFGFKAEEVVGRPFFEILHPEDRDKTAAVFRRAVATRLKMPTEFRVLDKAGQPHWVEEAGRVQLDEAGRSTGIIGVLRNVDERKTAERRIRELGELKSRFLQIVAHQLRTPLNAVRWNLESVLSGGLGKLDDAQREFIHISHVAIVDIIGRIGDVLTAMDIEEGRTVFEAEAVSLENLVASVLVAGRAQGQAKGVTVDYARPLASLPEIKGDVVKLRTAIEKMLGNALIYTLAGGRISVRLAAAGSAVRFEVSDTGIGIPAAEQGRIFERFFRASNAAAVEPNASGLGLSIARHYVEQHGGRMGFESVEGKGSTFWLELPAASRS